MRFLIPTITVSFFLWTFALACADSSRSTESPKNADPPRSIAAPTTVQTPPAAAGDAAARHVRRTDCLKNAKTKQLVGEQRAVFVRDCVAAS